VEYNITIEYTLLKNEIAGKDNAPEDHDIGILLDQEKAYDRINLDYLRKAMAKFGFLITIIDCVYNLLAYNTTKVNVNDYFTDPVRKKRGLKQGDPISPLVWHSNLFCVASFRMKNCMITT
jgi:hypothetical protein